MDRIIDILAQAGPDWGEALFIATNPVYSLCAWAQRRAGRDRGRILGYTLNDTLRIRTGIGQVLGAEPQSVEAWAIGERGDFCVPLFNRVKVAGIPDALMAEQMTGNIKVTHTMLADFRAP